MTPSAYQMIFGGGNYDIFVTVLNAAGSALVYSTFLGGPGDDTGAGIAVDRSGFAVVTGHLTTCTPPQNFCRDDAFLAKLDTIGSHLVYSGLINHGGAGIAVTLDSFSNAYIAGRPGTDLSTTPDALQPQGTDAYFGVIDPSGNLLYMSYFTGAYIQAIAVDPSGNVLLAGSAYSAISLKDPIQPLKTSTGDGFVAKISLPLGPQSLLFSSYFGGGTLVTGIASTSSGIVIAGGTGDTSFPITSDAAQSKGRGFIAKISDTGPCSFGAALANSQPVSGSGGTATINVTAATGCHWTANSDNPSILTIASGSSGTGNGTVTVSVAASSLVASRTSNVTVAGQVVTIAQAQGAVCTFTLDSTGASFPLVGGSGLIKVSGGSDQCFWKATTDVSWIHLQYIGGNGTDLPYRVDADNGPPRTGKIIVTAEATNSTGQTFTVTQPSSGLGAPSIVVSRSTLNFVRAGTQVTGPQTFDLTFYNLPNASWTADTGTGVFATPSHGVGNATIKVEVPFGTTSNVVISAPGAANSPALVNVKVTTASADPPFGSFDTPVNGATGIVGAIPVTGWALDNVEVSKVDIWREPVGAEPAGLVYIGDAVFVVGARPDVEAANPAKPFNYRAGWGYALLTNFLPGGNGVFKLHAIAHNTNSASTDLGTRVITVDNTHASKPFGTLDTPGQGGTASGNAYVNFGWALTQNPYKIPIDGSTITAYIDGMPAGQPTYNQFRNDIASLFPGLANSMGAVGFFYLDTTKLTNGVHTISWNVYDNQGRGEGIGSRYFNVLNSGTGTATVPEGTATQSLPSEEVKLRNGYDAGSSAEALTPIEDGEYSVDMEELGRIELQAGATQGYQIVNGERRALPIGSTLKDGTFYWLAGPGFIGEYEMIFERPGQGKSILVRVKIQPKKYSRREFPQ